MYLWGNFNTSTPSTNIIFKRTVPGTVPGLTFTAFTSEVAAAAAAAARLFSYQPSKITTTTTTTNVS